MSVAEDRPAAPVSGGDVSGLPVPRRGFSGRGSTTFDPRDDRHLAWAAEALSARLPAGAVRSDGTLLVVADGRFRLTLYRAGRFETRPLVASVAGEPSEAVVSALTRANAELEGLLRRALDRSGGFAEAALARRVGRACDVRRAS